jgi:hypothetical protein
MSIFSLALIFGIVIAALALGESVTVVQGIATGLLIKACTHFCSAATREVSAYLLLYQQALRGQVLFRCK